MIPRLSCVYCGTRIACAHTWPRLIACPDHASLVAQDPHYAAQATKGKALR